MIAALTPNQIIYAAMRRVLIVILIFMTEFSFGQSNSDWTGQVTFPANFTVGDCVEFVGVHPTNAGASGNYEISISYTRNSVATGATYLASISHSNPDIWREVGRVNSNGYTSPGSEGHCFTVDCNTSYANPRFRLRAIRVLGATSSPLTVEIKIRSISQNTGWTAINTTTTDLAINKFLPMTNDWSLYVGNDFLLDGASLAIKAIENGNVGIGTATPAEKLSVNGKIRAQEIKVESGNWPDYVFAKSYVLPSLKETDKYIKANGHLQDMPDAAEVARDGIAVGELNAKLLKKIEELTLHLILLEKNNDQQQKDIERQQQEVDALKLNK